MRTVRPLLPIAVLVAIFALFPVMVDSYYLNLGLVVILTVALCQAWNLEGGLAGRFSLAHVVYVALGAYVPVLLIRSGGISPWMGIVVAVALSLVAAYIITFLGQRFRLATLQFALVTIGIGELTHLAVVGTPWLGGASGLIVSSRILGSTGQYYALAAALVVTLWLLTDRITRTRLGYYATAVRDSASAASMLGISAYRARLSMALLSAGLAALVGSLHSQTIANVDPYYAASPVVVIEVLLFTTIGGLGTRWGPVVGAGLLVGVNEVVRGLMGATIPGFAHLLVGAAAILVVRFAPGGLVSVKDRLAAARTRPTAHGEDVVVGGGGAGQTSASSR